MCVRRKSGKRSASGWHRRRTIPCPRSNSRKWRCAAEPLCGLAVIGLIDRRSKPPNQLVDPALREGGAAQRCPGVRGDGKIAQRSIAQNLLVEVDGSLRSVALFKELGESEPVFEVFGRIRSEARGIGEKSIERLIVECGSFRQLFSEADHVNEQAIQRYRFDGFRRFITTPDGFT